VRIIRVARNVVTNYLRFFSIGVIAFLLTPIMVRVLGDEGYGLWVTVFSLTGYFGLVDQGLRPSLVRYVSRDQARGDVEGLSRTLSSALLLYGCAGALVLLLTVVAALQFGHWFRIDPAQLPAAQATVLLAGLSLAIGFPFGVFGATLSGLQRYDIANGLGIVVAIVRALVFVVVLRMGGGIVALGWVALATNLLGHILTRMAVQRLLPDVRITLRHVSAPHLRLIGAYSGYAFIGALAASLTFKSSALVITAFMGAALVTPFAIAAGLVDNARTLVHSATWVLSPTASELETLGEKDKLHLMLIDGAKYSVLLCWPVLFALIVFGGNLLETWVPADWNPVAATVLTVLSIPTLVALPQSAASSVLFGVSRHRGVVVLAMISALATLLLSILWARSQGLVGVALGTAVPLLLVGGVATAVYAARALDMPLGRYLWEGMVRPGLVSMVFLGPALLIQAWWRPTGWGPLALAVGVPWLVFAALAWQVGLAPSERTRWKGVVPRLFGAGAKPTPAAVGEAGR
jgi:O-antigen/teichoic acid export membrane protein